MFKLDATGTETVLYSFTGGADGANPEAGLVRDPDGSLYGTTIAGGSGSGVVFKVDSNGTETVLHTFTSGADGGYPQAGLIRDLNGDLYGTTSGGGSPGPGVVFKLDTTGAETVLYTFTGGADGGTPYGGLVRDSAGNLYGSTLQGGVTTGSQGYGVVFKLDAAGTETVLYTFTGGSDGASPYAGLVRDSAGNLYGTTYGGGRAFGNTGAETVLHTFAGGTGGAKPQAGLIRDAKGNLYGTTVFGGSGGNGVVFKLTP